MEVTLFQVDAFTTEVLGGNPAAVCPLDSWLPDEQMQAIAQENNLSETAFFVKNGEHYALRWFTPAIEVDLCGHATLATAHTLFNHLNYSDQIISFQTKSGKLTVEKEGDQLVMNFPNQKPASTDIPDHLVEGLGEVPQEVLRSVDYVVVYENEETIASLVPNFFLLNEVDTRGIIVTAPGNEVDFVSRFFAPRADINEDPVTGSAHCALTPYWAEKLEKNELAARQISQRVGELFCTLKGDRVELAGNAVTYMKGKIWV
ncbi:MAG: PhzF family phenazine biosynthesis protein [Bacteroidota bacterium]